MEGTMATIMLFAADFAPRNWALCNGQTIQISSNTALFSLLGTTYGGNGTTTFNLPDFRGRAAVGTDPNYQLGQVSGTPSVTLLTSNMAPHTHTAAATLTTTSTAPNTDEGPNNILAGANIYAAGSNGQLAGVTEAPSSVTGSNAPVSVMQPYLGMNFVICQFGIFPSRN